MSQVLAGGTPTPTPVKRALRAKDAEISRVQGLLEDVEFQMAEQEAESIISLEQQV
jgi:hypothetical protein